MLCRKLDLQDFPCIVQCSVGGGGVCRGGEGDLKGAICLGFWSLQECLSVNLQLVFKVDSRKERKENSVY